MTQAHKLYLLSATCFVGLVLGDRWYGNHHEICTPIIVKDFAVSVPKCTQRNIPLKQCVGTCLSKDNFDGDGKTSCTCCKPVRSNDVTVQLYCLNKKNHIVIANHVMKQHEECACAPCVNGKKRDIKF